MVPLQLLYVPSAATDGPSAAADGPSATTDGPSAATDSPLAGKIGPSEATRHQPTELPGNTHYGNHDLMFSGGKLYESSLFKGNI